MGTPAGAGTSVHVPASDFGSRDSWHEVSPLNIDDGGFGDTSGTVRKESPRCVSGCKPLASRANPELEEQAPYRGSNAHRLPSRFVSRRPALARKFVTTGPRSSSLGTVE